MNKEISKEQIIKFLSQIVYAFLFIIFGCNTQYYAAIKQAATITLQLAK